MSAPARVIPQASPPVPPLFSPSLSPSPEALEGITGGAEDEQELKEDEATAEPEETDTVDAEEEQEPDAEEEEENDAIDAEAQAAVVASEQADTVAEEPQSAAEEQDEVVARAAFTLSPIASELLDEAAASGAKKSSEILSAKFGTHVEVQPLAVLPASASAKP